MTNRRKKVSTLVLVTSAVAFVTGALYTLKQLRDDNKRRFCPALIEKVGHPDPTDIEDNNMVAEGSQFPIQYYNRWCN